MVQGPSADGKVSEDENIFVFSNSATSSLQSLYTRNTTLPSSTLFLKMQ